MITKILVLTDAFGNLVHFVLLPGQRFETVGVPPLFEGLAFDALIADKAFDSNVIKMGSDHFVARSRSLVRIFPSSERCRASPRPELLQIGVLVR